MIACFGGGGYDNGWWGVLEQYRAPATLMRPRLLSFTVESNDFDKTVFGRSFCWCSGRDRAPPRRQGLENAELDLLPGRRPEGPPPLRHRERQSC